MKLLGKLAALLASVSAHAAMAMALWAPAPVETEGRAGGETARIGAAFADMAAGTLTPSSAEMPAPAQPLETVRAEPLAVQAQQKPLIATRSTATPAAAATPLQMAAVAPSQSATPTPQPAPVVTPPEPPEKSELAPKEPTTRAAPRPKDLKTAKPAQTQAAKPAAPKSQKGNAERTASAGQADGQKEAKSVTAGKAGASKEAGNAAVSNYPGQVMRRLSRVSKPKVRTSGTAGISFQIAANGGLASASVARASGSPELDRAALRVVQRAAPFPAPPAGAKRQFYIEFDGS